MLRALTVLTPAAVMTTALSLTMAGTASAGLGTPAKPTAHLAATCRDPSIKVHGTGVPRVDRRHIQQAISLGETN